jgi:general secretion pathway protein I
MMRRSDAGFTLLEVIVALAIAAASVASLYQIYALGWRGVRLAELDRAAIEVAQNQLASAGVETALQDGEDSGVSPEGIKWATKIVAYESADAASLPPLEGGQNESKQQLPLVYRVRVTVEWKEGPARPNRVLELETIKLQRVAP